MKRIVLSVVTVMGMVSPAILRAQSPAAPAPIPMVAYDITKADVDLLLKNSPPAIDQQMRVVDMGKYNLGVGIIHRGPTNEKPGEPVAGPYHDYTAETYIILSGGGTLTTGGTMLNKKPSPGVNVMNGPGGNATAGPGSYSRNVGPGDIIIIPPGVLHVWTHIPDQVTYLSVRPDPDRALPGGYVNPLLLKNQPPPAK
jgi:hypothetical protein